MNDVDTLEELEPTQVPANAAPPTLNVDAPAVSSINVPVENVGSVSSQDAYIKTSVNDANNNQNPKLEASNVNIEIPTSNGQNNIVETKDLNNDGIPDSTVGESVLVDQTKLDSVKNVTKSKKKIKINFGSKTMPFTLALILILVAAILGLSLGASMFSQTIYKNSNYIETNSNASLRVADGNNNITSAGTFKYTIPSAYYYDKLNGGILVYDKDDTFRIYIRDVEGIYDDIANTRKSVEETMKDAGLSVASIKEIEINDRLHVVAEVTDNLTNKIIAYTKADDANIFFIEVVASSNNYDYDVLDVADDIIENATKLDDVSSMEKIEVTDITSLIVKAAEEYKSLSS